MQRSPGILPSDFASWLRRFADSTSLCWRGTGSHPCEPPCGLFRQLLHALPYLLHPCSRLRHAAATTGPHSLRVLRSNAEAKADLRDLPASSFSRLQEEVPTAIDWIDREQRMLARRVSLMDVASQADKGLLLWSDRYPRQAAC